VHLVNLHHVWEEEAEPFAELLGLLSRSHAFISYSEAVERIETGAISRPYMAFTFDDGFRSGLAAAEIMRPYGATACYFVCPELVGLTDGNRLAKVCRERFHARPQAFLTWAELEGLVGDGHEVGGHTWSHARLSSLSPEEAEDEIAASARALQQRLGSARHFAWPYGRFGDMTAAAARAVYAAGYVSCASAERGCHPPPAAGSHPCLRREHCIAAWPLRHTVYFLTRSARQAREGSHRWPAGWSIAGREPSDE
jgi:peptidoglycan/xylan/chitin deacetylase (PgdA/CDA1 family)